MRTSKIKYRKLFGITFVFDRCVLQTTVDLFPYIIFVLESYLQLLCELTDVGSVGHQEYIATFNQMMRCPDTYYILVLENTSSNQIIAAATLVIERKFIHSCAKRGHIEDLVVCPEYRGKNFGKFLVEALVAIGKHRGCYKISLDCKDDKVRFYERVGFVRLNNIMYLRLDTPP
ncbi:glucosamine-phosphate N-acetyltransferase [Paragonimus westermani]|uniref:Glucosamine 6-phosphate N-acetyltransferase n=1 Tax=Paragonimus westermani TaxID=34504 RepID=A0A5J4NUK6_9TREM|nr:glucosamine-phosphate N-acetyltransferase [Paragonimus westermani]